MQFTVGILTALAMLAGAGAAFAQDATQDASGSFTGTLIDPNRNVVTGLDGVSVILKNTATGASAEVPVAHDGSFTLKGLAPGTYDVSVPIPCCMYATYYQKSVVIAAGQTLQTELHVGWGMNLGTIGDDPVQLSADMRMKTKHPEARAPRSADGHPDLSGVWANVADVNAYRGLPPMRPWAADMEQKLLGQINEQQRNAGAYCLPQFATPSVGPFPYKFVQTPKEIVQIMEFMTPNARQIFLDGRAHPDAEHWNPAWYGHSVGHWEGDTLVVDTVGFNEVTPGPGFAIHSERLHVVERYRRINYGTMELEVTADDADAWTGPYTRKYTAGLAEGDEIQEFVCVENNKLIGPVGWKGRPSD
jgi:hypothetical protein